MQCVVWQHFWIVVDSVQRHLDSSNGARTVELSSRKRHSEAKIKRRGTVQLLNIGIGLQITAERADAWRVHDEDKHHRNVEKVSASCSNIVACACHVSYCGSCQPYKASN